MWVRTPPRARAEGAVRWSFVVHRDRERMWLGVVLHGSRADFVAAVARVCQIMVTYGIGGPDRWKRPPVAVEEPAGAGAVVASSARCRRPAVSVFGLTVGK